MSSLQVLAKPEDEGANEFQADGQNPDIADSFSRSGLGYEHYLIACLRRDWSGMPLTLITLQGHSLLPSYLKRIEGLGLETQWTG
jgi:hypothetical protein